MTSDVEAGTSTTPKKCMNPGEVMGRLTSNLRSPRQTGSGDRRAPETLKFVGATADRPHLEIRRLDDGARRTGRRGGRRSAGELASTTLTEHGTGNVTGPHTADEQRTDGRTVGIRRSSTTVSECRNPLDGRTTDRAGRRQRSSCFLAAALSRAVHTRC